MTPNNKTLPDGHIILSEREVPKNGYKVISGNVECFSSDGASKSLIKLIEPGGLLAVEEFLNGKKVSYGARSIGPVVVESLDRITAKKILRSEQRNAQINKKQIEYDTDNSIIADHSRPPNRLATASVDEVPEAILPVANPLKSSLFERLLNPKASKGSNPIEVRIALLDNDDSEVVLKTIIKELSSRRGLNIKKVKKVLQLADSADILVKLSNMETRARAWLREIHADVLVWGTTGVVDGIAHLRFFSANSPDPDQPSLGDGASVFPVAIDLPQNSGDLLHAAILAANEPKSAGKRQTIARDLPVALGMISDVIPIASRFFTVEDKADIYATVGRCYAVWAKLTTLAEDYNASINAFDLARELLAGKAESTTSGLIFRDVALMMQYYAERTNDTEILRESTIILNEAILAMPPDALLSKLAIAEKRFGLALMRLDSQNGDVESLRQALNAFQSALQIYDRYKTPKEWAEIMGHIAQVTQIIGQHLKSPDTLAKAIEASLAVLKVIVKNDRPLLWAATQNNLGSARFLLGKLTRDEKIFEEATAAFSMAHEIYLARGAERMANLTKKNLRRAEALSSRAQPSQPPPVPWELDDLPAPRKDKLSAEKVNAKQPSAPKVIFGQEMMREFN